MKISSILQLFTLLILLGCSTSISTSDNYTSIQTMVIDIRELNKVYLLETVSNNHDSILLISRKINPYFNQLSGIKKNIMEGGVYIFKTSFPDRMRVGEMEQLGYHLLIENDTIWSGSQISQSPCFSVNSEGLSIIE